MQQSGTTISTGFTRANSTTGTPSLFKRQLRIWSHVRTSSASATATNPGAAANNGLHLPLSRHSCAITDSDGEKPKHHGKLTSTIKAPKSRAEKQESATVFDEPDGAVLRGWRFAASTRPASNSALRAASNSRQAAPPGPWDPRCVLYRQQHAAMFFEKGTAGNNAFSRAESFSSATLSSRTVISSGACGGGDSPLALQPSHHQPFAIRGGRTFTADPTLLYPLPVDLAELHRQSLRTMLLFQLFGGPVCSPAFANRPPTRVLEVGCGSGFWSMMCYRYYNRHGHTGISFTGMDIAPIAPGAQSKHRGSVASNSTSASDLPPTADGPPDRDMRWRFVLHDMRRVPWPFQDEEFDLIMVKDMSLAMTTNNQQIFMDEFLRILAPGGSIEVWESDLTLRMLRPHVPDRVGPGASPMAESASSLADRNAAQRSTRSRRHKDPGLSSSLDSEDSNEDDSDNDDSDEDGEKDEHEVAATLGAYVMTANTPLSSPNNNFLVEYNGWLAKALEARTLSTVPCTLVGPLLVQEAETLTGVDSRRLAVPLGEVRWECEGVGGVVTKDGNSYIETKGKGPQPGLALPRVGSGGFGSGKVLTPAQAALRRTALLTVVQMIQGLEMVLREVSGKSRDEWDTWLQKMMNDLINEDGTSWGECLEIGAWWAKKRVRAT